MTEALIFVGAGIPGMPGGGDGAPAEAPPATHTGTQPAPTYGTEAVAPEPVGMSMVTMLIWFGVIFGGMYFLMIRPQRKREKKMREMQSAITTGDNIVTSGGLFGKVADVGEDCFIVEFGTNRGIRIPVLKADVVAVREPKMTPPPQVVES